MLRMMSTYHMGAHVKPRPFVDTNLPLQPVFAQEGYAGHASLFGHLVAAPRVARRAKRGGARRDRTADLVIANDALSQLSYGPLGGRVLRSRPATGAIYNPRRAQVKNSVKTGSHEWGSGRLPYVFPGLPLFGRVGTDI